MILPFKTKDVCLIINSSGRVAVTRPGECVRTAPGCGEEGASSGSNTGSSNSGGGGGGSGGSAASKPATATTTPMIDPYTTPSPVKMTCDNADLPVRSSKVKEMINDSELELIFES